LGEADKLFFKCSLAEATREVKPSASRTAMSARILPVQVDAACLKTMNQLAIGMPLLRCAAPMR